MRTSRRALVALTLSVTLLVGPATTAIAAVETPADDTVSAAEIVEPEPTEPPEVVDDLEQPALVIPDGITISGAVRVGETVAVDPSPADWAPGGEAPTVSVRWLIDGVEVAGATDEELVLTPDLVGLPLSARLTAVRGEETVDVDVEPVTVAPGEFVAPVPAPVISGSARVGEVLTVSVASWSPTASFAYQWKVDGVAVGTGASYTPTAENNGGLVTVEATGTAGGYTTQTVASAGVVVGTGAFSSAPQPTISGTAQLGKTLTVNAPSWTPRASFTYRWLVDGVPVAAGTTSYAPKAVDVGRSVTVEATGSAPGFESRAVTSAGVKVSSGVFSAAPAPKVSGTAQVGKKLTAAAGTWAPKATLSYQWKVNGSSISGATSSSYTVKPADLGKKVTVTVTGRASAYTTTSVTSAATKTVVAGTFSAPTPKASGTVQVGKKLTASAGTWSPKATLSYQWRANGSAIKGATKSSYTLAASLHGKKITVTVTGKATGYTTKSVTSKTTAAVTKPFSKTVAPRITGKAEVGATLKAAPGTWSPKATFSYQWKANGKAISGATKSSYKIPLAQKGKRLTVTVTGKRSTYVTSSRTSSSTAVVKLPKGISTPKVTSNPKTVFVATGKAATFSARATGGSLRYQWQYSTDGKNWTNLSGKTSTSLKLTAKTALSGRDYRVRVSNVAGTKYSKVATLYVDSSRSDRLKPDQVFALSNYVGVFGKTQSFTHGSSRDLVAPVTVCYAGSGSGLPWLDLDVVYVGGNGKVYDDNWEFIDGDIWDTDDVWSGECADFWTYAHVPASAVSGGYWRITDSSDWSMTTVQFVDR